MDGFKEITIKQLITDRIIEEPMDGNHGELHPTSKDYVSYGIPFIMASDISNGKVNYKTCKFISQKTASGLRKGFSKNGDVLLTHKGTIGETAIVKGIKTKYIVLTPQVTYYRIIDNNKLDRIYLKYMFNSRFFQKPLIERASSGSTRAYIGIKQQQDLSILLPPLPEQQAIATTLSDMDELISSLDELIEKKKDIKKGAMQKLLSPKEGWIETTLGEVVTLCNGYAFQSSTYVENGKYKIVTITNVKNGVFDTSSFSMINDVPSNLQSHQILKIDDIIVSMTGNVGRVCKVTEKNCLLNQRVGVLKFKTSKVDKGYLYSILNSDLFETDMILKGHGAAQPNIGKPEIEGFELSYPPTIEEQQEIATTLSDMDKEIEALEEKKAKYEQIKQGAMQKLLTGKIRLV